MLFFPFISSLPPSLSAACLARLARDVEPPPPPFPTACPFPCRGSSLPRPAEGHCRVRGPQARPPPSPLSVSGTHTSPSAPGEGSPRHPARRGAPAPCPPSPCPPPAGRPRGASAGKVLRGVLPTQSTAGEGRSSPRTPGAVGGEGAQGRPVWSEGACPGMRADAAAHASAGAGGALAARQAQEREELAAVQCGEMERLRRALADRLIRGGRGGAPDGSDLSRLRWSVKDKLGQGRFAEAYDAQALVREAEARRAAACEAEALGASEATLPCARMVAAHEEERARLDRRHQRERVGLEARARTAGPPPGWLPPFPLPPGRGARPPRPPRAGLRRGSSAPRPREQRERERKLRPLRLPPALRRTSCATAAARGCRRLPWRP